MCVGLQPVGVQPDPRWPDVGLAEDLKSRRRSVVQNHLLEDEAIHRPDLILAVVFVSGLGVGGVIVRVW